MEGEKLDLSLRGSRTRPGGETEVEIKDPEIQGLEDLVVNQKVRGYVKAITDVGVYVRYDNTSCFSSPKPFAV